MAVNDFRFLSLSLSSLCLARYFWRLVSRFWRRTMAMITADIYLCENFSLFIALIKQTNARAHISRVKRVMRSLETIPKGKLYEHEGIFVIFRQSLATS
jgi:hypothetical protein